MSGIGNNEKTYGRVFAEGLAFGAGLTLMAGALRWTWKALTKDDVARVSDDDELGAAEEEYE